ncbi:MAG: hypothetical protein EAX86_02085 [Candidatus Heimdallarchaeota archaeon]|nr:hypothetical protein [Candidatus Heimdallarchaeota archaeon]
MSLKQILEKFAEAFSVKGIFLQTPTELFPIIQERADTLLILKRKGILPAGITEITIGEHKLGVIVEVLHAETKLILMADSKNIEEIRPHWKRFLPAVEKGMDINEFIQQESIETKLLNALDDIHIALTEANKNLKEKMNIEAK